jgi:hypothetical protein
VKKIINLKKAVLKSFNPGNYTATVQLAGDHKSYLEGIAVSYNIPSEEMIAGRHLIIAFFTQFNASDAAVIAVYF